MESFEVSLWLDAQLGLISVLFPVNTPILTESRRPAIDSVRRIWKLFETPCVMHSLFGSIITRSSIVATYSEMLTFTIGLRLQKSYEDLEIEQYDLTMDIRRNIVRTECSDS